MKHPFLLTLAALCLPACAFRAGRSDANGTSYTAMNVGIREKNVAQTPGVYVAEEASGVETAGKFLGTIQHAIWGNVLKGVAGDALGTWQTVTKAKEATKAAQISAQAATEQAAIQAAATPAPLP